MADSFETNLMRAAVSMLWYSAQMQTSRELFGKAYHSLSPAEKTAVDQMATGFAGANYQLVTPHWLAAQANNPVGFQVGEAQQQGTGKK